MTELVRGLGALLRKGWRPMRTIILASWDAEEYGLIGSTEFAEDHGDWLANKSESAIDILHIE
jgi:N-acetylated-alpha-linked acidic dipeptidase